MSFAGLEWQVRDGTGGPGPNTFSAQNVSVDQQGRLHLRIVKTQGNRWTCAEVFLAARYGFGRYEFRLLGRPDQLDDRFDPDLAHQRGAMSFDRLDTDPQHLGDFFVAVPLCQ